MAGERKLTVLLAGDASHLKTAFKEGENASEGFGSKLGKLASPFGVVAKIASGFMVGAGLMKLPGFLSGAAQSAAEDAAATERLNGTLENLVSRGASAGLSLDDLQKNMDLTIKNGQKLAFSDDQVRDSMQFLLNATDDYGEALKRHKLAMDLSRGANIDLGAATKLLGKMNEENVGGLKKLGIEMKAGATEAEALAAVQARFGGQSEKFAKSAAGQWAQAKLAMSETVEGLGAALLPILAAIGGALAKVLPIVQEFVGELGGKVAEIVVPALERVRDAALAFAGVAWDAMQSAWETIAPLLELVAGLTWDALKELATLGWDKMQGAWTVIGDKMGAIPWGKVGAEAGETSNWAAAWAKVKEALQPAIDVLKPLVEKILTDLKAQFDDISAALGPLVEALAPLQPLLEPLVKVIGTYVVAAIAAFLIANDLMIKALTVFLVTAIDTATLAIESITTAVSAMGPVFEAASGVVATVAGAVKSTVQDLADGIGTAMGGVADLLSKPFEIAALAIKGALNGVITGVNAMIGALNDLQIHIPEVGVGPLHTPGFDWNGLNLPTIPLLARGGIVMKPTLAFLGEGGPEAVIPLSRGRGAGGDIHVHTHIAGNVYGVDDLVRVIDLSLKRAGRAGILQFATGAWR